LVSGIFIVLGNLAGVAPVGRRCKASGRDVPSRRKGDGCQLCDLFALVFIVLLVIYILNSG
jgi:hypothetical protein